MNEDNSSQPKSTPESEHEEETPQINREDLSARIKQYFDESLLDDLEKYYVKKTEDIDELMYTFHDYYKEVESLKLKMPIVKPPEASKFIKKRDDDLFGGSSTMSRRSNSSTTSRSFGNSTKFSSTKGGLGAQKVSINIGDGLDQNSKLNSSIMRRGTKSIDPKVSALKADLAGTSKVSKSHETVFSSEHGNKKAEKTPSQTKLHTEPSIKVEKSAKLNETTTKGIIEAAKSNSKGAVLVKKSTMGSNLPTSESIDKEANSKVKSAAKPAPGKTTAAPASNSLKTPLKKSEILNKVKSNSSSMATAETENPKFKFEPKKKSGGLSGNGKFESNIKGIDDNQHLRSNSENTRYKNVNNLNNITGKAKPLLQTFLNDFNNLPIFISIFKYLGPNERIIFKNTTKTLHKCFFQNEILELERVIFEKKKEDNPLYSMTLSQDLLQKVSYSKAFLSENLSSYKSNQKFKNFIDMLYVFLFTSGGNGIIYLIKTKSVVEKVNEIEEFISRVDRSSNKNIYAVFNECYTNLTKNKEIYNTLKYLNESNCTIFDVEGLPEEFSNFISLIKTLKEHISIGQNMEAMIELEILNHKLDKIKSFAEIH